MAVPASQRKAQGGDKRRRDDISNMHEPIPVTPLGEPIIHLTEGEERMFKMFRDEQLLDGVAFQSDNFALCQLSKLAFKESIDEIKATERTEMFKLLISFGLMPSARRHVEQRDKNGHLKKGFKGIFDGSPDLKLIKEEKVEF